MLLGILILEALLIIWCPYDNAIHFMLNALGIMVFSFNAYFFMVTSGSNLQLGMRKWNKEGLGIEECIKMDDSVTYFSPHIA